MIMTNTEFKNWLTSHAACGDAVQFADSLGYDPVSVWNRCDRGDWLLWWAGRVEGLDRKKLVKAAVECAALALPYTTDQRVHDCIRISRLWCEGKATDEELETAIAAAWSAANASLMAARAAAYAAESAWAAYAARAAWAAWAAAEAAARAARAAAAYAYTHKQCAEIVRQYITIKDLGI